MDLKRKKRVRVHLADPNPNTHLPSVEGILVARRRREYALAVPRLLVNAEAQPLEPDCRLLLIPRERVAFYEEL